LAKRLIIICIYLALLFLIAYVIYGFLKSDETCFDKIKNQNEEDVDCGGKCSPCGIIKAQSLSVQNSGFVENGRPKEYDAWAIVSNPNNSFGAKSFEYEIKLKGSSGETLAQRNGAGFVLPGDRKYIVESNIFSDVSPREIQLEIKETEWVEFSNYYEKPNLGIVSKNYRQVNSGAGFSEASGLLRNETPYDFNVIKVQVILKDFGGNVVALNSTEMRTVKSGEEREFKSLWINRFSGEVANIEAQAEINIFESEAFIKNAAADKK